MKERVLFISEWEQGNLSMTALCRKFAISRQTGYKWVRRYQELGCCAEALTDLSRAPNYHPWTTPPELVDLVIRAGKKWPRWGPQKLHDWLAEKYPEPGRELIVPRRPGERIFNHEVT